MASSFAALEAMDKIDGAENNENKKKDLILKKPLASLLTSYNQTWKPAPNHFLRYSDVRVRDDRRPSVMDLANQPRVLQRVNGWKTYLIKAEIDEVVRGKKENKFPHFELLIFHMNHRSAMKCMKWKFCQTY